MELNKDLLIERLSTKLDLRGAFLYDYGVGEGIKTHLMVVISPVKGVSPSTLSPIVKLCMSDMEEIPFHVVLEGGWLSELRKGSLYHSYASLPKHRLYYAKAKEIDALLNKKIVNSLMELNRLDYEKARQYAAEYATASVDFAAKGSHDQAVYMLHQSIEVRIRSFYTLLGRQLGKNHNLENIIRNVRGIVPELLSVFAYETADVELYRLLDMAYKACVKGGALEISVEQYEFIRAQSVCLAEILDAMVDRMATAVAAYRALLPADKPEVEKKPAVEVVEQKEPLNTSQQVVCESFSDFPWPQHYKDDANQLLDDIYSKHRPEQILLVNYRTGGVTKGNPFQEKAVVQRPNEELEMHLVVLMKNRGPFRFREIRRGVVSAMLIFLEVSYVEKTLKNGGRFVNAVWKNGWLLRKKASFDKSLISVDIDWKLKADKMEIVACNADATMKNLLGVMNGSNVVPCDSALLTLHQLTDIGVRTYLRCAVGYIPEYADLTTLIDLCSIADSRVIDYFYTWNQREKELLTIALTPHQIWWTNSVSDFSVESKQATLGKAKEIVEFFGNLCKEAVQSMQSRIIEPMAEPATN
ncbi:MAG: hypothetical protein LBE37_20575 [Sphingobacterium sp.]|jgi:HEPN domain-containing protein|nr:hypothetical protein [Sphingobacterium sp.]